jgi:hypothetical protein
MFGLGTMAGFAGEHDVLAQFFLLDDVGVADFANVMAGKRNRASGDLADSCSAVMTILPETARNHRGTDGHEEDQRSNHYSGEPNQVFEVFEHRCQRRTAGALRKKAQCSSIPGICRANDDQRHKGV